MWHNSNKKIALDVTCKYGYRVINYYEKNPKVVRQDNNNSKKKLNDGCYEIIKSHCFGV